MLAQYGIESSVYEAREKNISRDRGDVLHRSGQAAIAQIGLSVESSEAATQISRFSLAREDGNSLASIEINNGLDLVSWRHSSLMDLLRQRAEKQPEISIEYGARVRNLVRSGNKIIGVETSSGVQLADLTVLASGGVSPLSKQHTTGAKDFRSRFVNMVVESHPDWLGVAAYILNPAGVSVLVPLSHGQTRIGIQLRGSERVVSREEALTKLTERLPWWRARGVTEKPTTHVLTSHGTTTWGQEGLVLVGDAAHKLHPIGGYGMNTGLTDATVLAKLISGSGETRSIHRELRKTRNAEVRSLRRWTDFYGRFGDFPQMLSNNRLLKLQPKAMHRALMKHLAISVDRSNYDA